VFRQRLQRYLPKLGLKEAPRLYIADQTRRWGSCNERGELRLNWRLVGAPLSLVDYVIVHELCHLRWRDHSARFWRELRRAMPEFQIHEQALAQVGPELIF
jgi:predicted metal-dependent hydrolase